MDLNLDPETAHIARVGSAAFAGGVMFHALRPAASVVGLLTRMTASVLAGLVFTDPVMIYFSIGSDFVWGVGALIGLCGLSVAHGVLRAVEKFDFTAFFKGAK